MKQTTTFTTLFALLLVLLSAGLSAQSDDLVIAIQGTLKDASGISVEDGQREITFRLYDNITAPLADAVWTETALVTVSGGIYSHNLGSEEELVAGDFNTTLWLGVMVEGLELSPRTQMTYAPYALAVNSTQQIARQGCSGQVGDIKHSILDPTQFAEENGECWVPMDGRAIPGTRLASIMGQTSVPDMSGLFIRATEYNDGNDSGRSPMAAATLQGDDNKAHSHTMEAAGAHTHSYNDSYLSSVSVSGTCLTTLSGSLSRNGSASISNNYETSGGACDRSTFSNSDSSRPATGSSGNHTHVINESGSPEARPKNMNFYIYIRVD